MKISNDSIIILTILVIITTSLKIDNRLSVIKNDCYERLAIGHRLNSKNVYKKFNASTVKDCQMACTKEELLCKSFSFGIGVKGNATCEASIDPVKETTDLKPIDTISDTDFDLYIKKLDCKMVIEKNEFYNKPPPNQKPVNQELIAISGTAPKPQDVGYGSNQINLSQKPPPFNSEDNIHHVQTLVSISTGPNKPILHPVHEILIGEGVYHYGRPIYRPNYDDGEKPPFRPPYLNHPYENVQYNHKPQNSYNFRPDALLDRYDSHSNPNPPSSNSDKFEFDPIVYKPIPDRYASYIPHPDNYFRPNKPMKIDYLPNMHHNVDRYDKPQRPSSSSSIYDDYYPTKPNHQDPSNPNYYPDSPYPSSDNSLKGPIPPKNPHSKPIVSENVGAHGESIISIITEIKSPCFRRVLAGKRVTRAFVKRALSCERIEDCQSECADEKRFVCEGFNYRLDPTGRGKGECELLDLPLSRLDIGRDLYPDQDYDYYEKDRNAASFNCKGRPSGYLPPEHGYAHRPPDYFDKRYDYEDYGRPHFDKRPDYFDDRRRPLGNYDYNYKDDYRPNYNGRGDYSYSHSHHSQHQYENSHSYNYNYRYDDRSNYQNHNNYHGTGYLPPNPQKPPPYDYKSYEPYLPINRRYHNNPPSEDKIIIKYYIDRDNDKSYFGYNNKNYGQASYLPQKNYYLPAKPDDGGSKNWGQYGGNYGNGGNYNYNYNKFEQGQSNLDYWGLHKQEKPIFIPPNPQYQHIPDDYESDKNLINALLPAEPRHPTYNFLKDECSLRSATGFRLHKGIVKKYYAVPNIYECELLCFKEKHFRCSSYAYRYTVTLNSPTDNCYLSNRNYKELDFYTDLQPDRDFDIYTMNNQDRCQQPIVIGKDESECFWRVRSGQRLDQKVVRDSLTVKSIVECQIECLKCSRFTCRGFSFRYGSPIIGGAIDNCQLTDWPFYELDPRIHFVPEPGFESYERGSFGHGCEPDHFGIRGIQKDKGHQIDQLCYIGFGSPARLLPQSTRKSLRCDSEFDCKEECSKLREGTIFNCMSFSYRTRSTHGEANCLLSDILQRDLLPNIDYIPDSDSWLFAWDNYNPKCIALTNEPIHDNHISGREGYAENRLGYGIGLNMNHFNALDTWRVYSVSGWPCRRGSLCHENREAGFWFCELEGGDENNWDYCCRPDHQCGYSDGFHYQWCYVGPVKTQWRKCSDRYYPYIPNSIDKNDIHYLPQGSKPPYQKPSYVDKDENNYLPQNGRPLFQRPGIRPDRPPAPPIQLPPRPSLDQYEMDFDNEFLEPPRPGGLGSRHWPVSYLHKEMPPNNTDLGRTTRKFTAIKSLIDIIKSNDLQNVQYQITNESNKEDDILFVKIPLPTNFSQESQSEKYSSNVNVSFSLPVDVEDTKNNTKRSQKSLQINLLKNEGNSASGYSPTMPPTYRRSYITRTNLTTLGKIARIERKFA